MDNHHDDDTTELAAAAAAAAALDVPQFHHPLQQPDFGQHHDHDPNKIEDVHIEHHIQHGHDDHHGLDVSVHGLEIPDDVTHDDLNLDLGMGTPQDVDLDMGSNDFRRPPTIRKGKYPGTTRNRHTDIVPACDLCHAAKQVSLACTQKEMDCS
jgi:hypothetical protein